MNAINRIALPDIQSRADARNLAIQKVGVRGVRHPVLIQGRRGAQPSVAVFDMYVGLAGDQKGTHMSRFLEILHAWSVPLSIVTMGDLIRATLTRLEATSGEISLAFPYFVKKSAPASGVESLLDHEVVLRAEQGDRGLVASLAVTTPVTSLCPCSKEISQYGAHNQRSHVSISVAVAPGASLTPEDLIDVAEASASCALWGLLKRPDEKWVTERAYENPKFVEDMVRDAALSLDQDPRVSRYEITSENFESIHNHSAYAVIRGPQ